MINWKSRSIDHFESVTNRENASINLSTPYNSCFMFLASIIPSVYPSRTSPSDIAKSLILSEEMFEIFRTQRASQPGITFSDTFSFALYKNIGSCPAQIYRSLPVAVSCSKNTAVTKTRHFNFSFNSLFSKSEIN